MRWSSEQNKNENKDLRREESWVMNEVIDATNKLGGNKKKKKKKKKREKRKHKQNKDSHFKPPDRPMLFYYINRAFLSAFLGSLYHETVDDSVEMWCGCGWVSVRVYVGDRGGSGDGTVEKKSEPLQIRTDHEARSGGLRCQGGETSLGLAGVTASLGTSLQRLAGPQGLDHLDGGLRCQVLVIVVVDSQHWCVHAGTSALDLNQSELAVRGGLSNFNTQG